MRIWCAVSGHGFGHFSQMAPLLNQLAAQIPNLEVRLAGNIPGFLATEMLNLALTQDT